MEQREKCIWCNRKSEDLQEVTVAVRRKPWNRFPVTDTFSVCSPECRQKFLNYVALYNRYGWIVLVLNFLLILALLASLLIAPSYYPGLSGPKAVGVIIMLLGFLFLVSPVLEGPEPVVPFPIARGPGFKHEGVRRMYWRARILGIVLLLLGLAFFLGWIPLFRTNSSKGGT